MPFANQHGSRLGLPKLGFLRRAFSRALFCGPSQKASGRGFESTVSPFLEAICDRARQEGPADFLGRRFSVLRFPALAEFIDAELRQARDFRGERISVQNRRPPLHDRFSRYFATFSSASKLICAPPRGARFAAPMTHTLLVSRHGASPARAGDFGQFPLLRGLVFSAAISPVPFAFQSPRSCRPSIRAMGEITRFMHGTERTSQRALTAQEIYTKWNIRNWRTERGINCRSDTPHLRLGRKRTGKRLSPHGRSGRSRTASRNQRNWFAAIVGAMTCRRVLSSGGIGDAASVSANAMGRWDGRGRRRSRSSLRHHLGRRTGRERARAFSA